VLLGTPLGNTLGTWRTYRDPDEKPLGTRREHVGNKGKNEKKNQNQNPKALRERKFVVYVEPCTHEFGS